MTTSELATLLNGREYGEEITEAECAQAKQDGLVVVFGYSDDNAEFRGAIYDEIGCYEGTELRVCRDGALVPWEEVDKDSKEEVRKWMAQDKAAKSIHAVWRSEGYSWTYQTSIPHETFDVMEDGDTYCRGIVFSIADL